jgi:hypothetical protein
MAALLGRPLTPWQTLVASVAGEYDPDDGNRLVHPLVTVSVPRQCGKTTLFMVRGSDEALTGGQAWYTADNGMKARKRWSDWLVRVPRDWRAVVRRAAGSELWETPAGGRFAPFPPTRDAIHGEQVDWAGIDEGWSHSEATGSELLTSIVPAQSTRPLSSTWIASTAGDYASTWWHSLVEAGRAGNHAHFEWRAPSDEAVFDPGTWAEWHPGVGNVLDPRKIPDLLTQMPNADDAIRSFGNRVRTVVTSKWPTGAWAAAVMAPPDPMPAVVALALDVAPDRDRASIGAAHLLPGGAVLVQLLATGPGTAWVADELRDLLTRLPRQVPVLYDTRAQARHVAGELRHVVRARWEPVEGAGFVRACTGMYAAVIAGECRVLSSPELDQAAAAAETKPVGDGWAWSRARSADDITALMACSLAWHHATDTPAAPPRVVARP